MYDIFRDIYIYVYIYITGQWFSRIKALFFRKKFSLNFTEYACTNKQCHDKHYLITLIKSERCFDFN